MSGDQVPPAAEYPVAEDPADKSAREKIAALTVALMLEHGVQPHVIVGALVANVTLLCCSTAPDVAQAHRSLNAAAKALKDNKRLVPMLVAKATVTRAAAANVSKAAQ